MAPTKHTLPPPLLCVAPLTNSPSTHRTYPCSSVALAMKEALSVRDEDVFAGVPSVCSYWFTPPECSEQHNEQLLSWFTTLASSRGPRIEKDSANAQQQ